jgi:hypothetical protein
MGKKYQSPYDPGDPYNGLPCTVIDSREVRRGFGPETDTLVVVRFEGGHTSTAWAEEIVDDGEES